MLPESERQAAFERLAMNDDEATDDNQPLDYIFSVEILNEGVDIVEVNQVIMLRPTQSPIVVCIFLCGIRTPIGAMFLTVFFYLLMLRRIKPMIYVAVIGFIGGSPSRVAVYPFYFG